MIDTNDITFELPDSMFYANPTGNSNTHIYYKPGDPSIDNKGERDRSLCGTSTAATTPKHRRYQDGQPSHLCGLCAKIYLQKVVDTMLPKIKENNDLEEGRRDLMESIADNWDKETSEDGLELAES